MSAIVKWVGKAEKARWGRSPAYAWMGASTATSLQATGCRGLRTGFSRFSLS